jgi:hypothetical protein
VTDEQLELTETVSEAVAGKRVGVGNLLVDDYETADGATAHGLTARLYVEDVGKVVVGPGSALEVGGTRFEVVDVVSGGDEGLGRVVLRPAPTAT